MPKLPLDTSRARCDTCGKPYEPGVAVYTLADKYDEEIEDRDVLISFRHWDCHTPLDVALRNLSDKAREIEVQLEALRRK